MKILHTADWHCREKDIEEIEKCLSFLVDTARAEAVDLTVIAGDIFDSQDLRLDSQSARLAVKTVSALADICPVAVIVGTPSHDGKSPEILAYVRGKHTVWVASTPQQVILAKGLLSLMAPPDRSEIKAVLSLIPQPTKKFFQTESDIGTADREIGAAMSGLLGGMGAQAAEYKVPHILVYHGGITGAQLSTGQTLTGQDIEVSLDQLDLAQARLNLCGHIHAAQKLGGHTFYAGSIYRNNWGEMERKGFYIFNLLGEDLVERNFYDTPCRKMVRVENDFTIYGPIEEYTVVLYSLSPEEIKDSFIRCDFKAWQDEAGKLDREKIREFYLSAGALDVDVRIIRVPREVVRAESVLKAERLRDKLTAMAKIKGEEVGESILLKADALEDKQDGEVLGEVAR